MSTVNTISDLQNRIALFNDMKAYNLLYELLFEQLCVFAGGFVKSPVVAEEIVSDVFIKLWQIRNSLMEIHNLKLYLYKATKNFSLNYLAKSHRHTSISLDEIDLTAEMSFSDPEKLCISADIIRKINEAIQLLPPRCRLIFRLVKEDGLSYKEAAEITGLSELTVRNQLVIALKKIAEVFPRHLLG